MAYEANSIGRDLMGHLFFTDSEGNAFKEGEEKFGALQSAFFVEKWKITHQISVMMRGNFTVMQIYDHLFPRKYNDPIRNDTYKIEFINNFVDTWENFKGK